MSPGNIALQKVKILFKLDHSLKDKSCKNIID